MDTKSDQAAVSLNNADILAQLIGDKRSTFWLGHYSENEVLHLLAKFDILPVLKAKGCDHPLINIEPLEAFEQALKIFNSTATTENLFVELRLHETSFSHPNLLSGAPQPMLKIDWLMLQTRQRFSVPNSRRCRDNAIPAWVLPSGLCSYSCI